MDLIIPICKRALLAGVASLLAITPAAAANQPVASGLLAYMAARADDADGDGAESVRRYAAALADAPAYDDIIQGRSGIAALNGRAASGST